MKAIVTMTISNKEDKTFLTFYGGDTSISLELSKEDISDAVLSFNRLIEELKKRG